LGGGDIDDKSIPWQGRSQTVTGVTVVMGPRGAREGCPKEPQEGYQKASGSEKGCESKGRCGLCLRKGKKRRKMNQSKGVMAALRDPGAPWGPKMGPSQSQGGPGRPEGQDKV
jgi:hypothetical protein